MIVREIFSREQVDIPKMFSKFLPIAMKVLKISKLPKIQLKAHIEDDKQPTFGRYVNDEITIHLALLDRHPVDILRTLAHELVHFKQHTEGRLGPNSGETGSPEENQAHEVAGVIIRHFNKMYPAYLKSKPLVFEYTLEERRKKKRKPRWAAYGPGPFGGYGYYAGYSGDSGSGDGGGDGGGGESIRELFDGGKDWKWTYQDKNQAMAEFTVGDVYYTFSAGQDPDEAPGDWEIEFAAKKEAGTASWGVTGTGNSAQVFGTVVEIMKAFIASKKASIRRMTFAAKEDSRQGLYARMVKRLLPKWNLEQKGEAFVLTRPGGLVFWVYSVEAPYNKIPPVKVKANTASEAEQIVLTTMPEFKGADLMGMGASKNKPNLGESRSNPDQNTRYESGMKELIANYKDISDIENWAISMTAEPKLGINPQVGISEDTPKGIYFYPLDYAADMARRGRKLPWGDNMPYIQLFQYDRSGEMIKETQVDPTRLKQALLQYCSEEVIQSAIDEPEYDGTPYWFIYDCLSRLGKSDETNIIRWNKVLRDLGFTSVFDDGDGWIAYNEPTQGVVLDPRVIKQLKTINNKQRSRVVTPAVIEQAIFETMDMELAANRVWQKYDPDGSKLRVAAKEYAKKPEFKQWFGKSGSEEIFDKAASWGRYGARQLSQEAYEWFKEQQAQTTTENFADGRNPQDKGDAKRHGVPTKASISTLRKVAKQGGRKGQLAHWMANMKSGRKNEF